MSPKLSAAEQSVSTLLLPVPAMQTQERAAETTNLWRSERWHTCTHAGPGSHALRVDVRTLPRPPERTTPPIARAVVANDLGEQCLGSARPCSVCRREFSRSFFAIFFPGLFDTHSSRTRSVVLVVDKTCCDTQLTHSIRIPTPTRRLNNRDREDPWYSLRGTDKD
jgi:hypothetical protein